MVEVGQRVRQLFPSEAPERVTRLVDDALLGELAQGVAGKLGGKIGIAPRIFLKRLIDVLDRVDVHPDFDPRQHYQLVVEANEMTDEERAAAGMTRSPDDIALHLPNGAHPNERK
jgi:hypothetical protein